MPRGWKIGEVALTQEMIRRGVVKETEKLSSRQLLQRAGFTRHKSTKQIQNIFKKYLRGTTIAQLILIYEHGGSWDKPHRVKPPNVADARLLASAATMAAKAAQKAHRGKIWKDANSDSFLRSFEWRRVRMLALNKYGARCQCCGASASDGIVIHVDHVKPRKLFPQLALDVDNLQILCEVCNQGKGNWDMTDWRPEEPMSAEQAAHLRDIMHGDG